MNDQVNIRVKRQQNETGHDLEISRSSDISNCNISIGDDQGTDFSHYLNVFKLKAQLVMIKSRACSFYGL